MVKTKNSIKLTAIELNALTYLRTHEQANYMLKYIRTVSKSPVTQLHIWLDQNGLLDVAKYAFTPVLLQHAIDTL